MRKNLATGIVVGASLMLGSAASAAVYDPAFDIVIDLGSFTLLGQGPSVDFDVIGPEGVVGFSFSGDASGVSGTATWASDTQLNIFINGVLGYSIGGFSGVSNPWDFQGGGSTSDGFYSSGPHLPLKDNPVAGGAEWTFSFIHDWDSAAAADITWSNATLTVHRIPAPGALALLGLAGLAGSRRRRA